MDLNIPNVKGQPNWTLDLNLGEPELHIFGNPVVNICVPTETQTPS